jgi:hypothetical protein
MYSQIVITETFMDLQAYAAKTRAWLKGLRGWRRTGAAVSTHPHEGKRVLMDDKEGDDSGGHDDEWGRGLGLRVFAAALQTV